LEHPHYTKPPTFKNQDVPKVLLSGDHAKIAAWRKQKSYALTKQNRMDLWQKWVQKNNFET
ncbi:MAG: tRNA (guanosine(37)-N1)-methyltransferase TrmD, partial [Pseudomonadota bacterium]